MINFLLSGFVGYCIGRAGHVLGGDLPGPHHWIYGLVLLIAGVFINDLITYFGLGLFISDWVDFTKGLFWGRDEPGPKKFWGFD